jgi:hypothetical protein
MAKKSSAAASPEAPAAEAQSGNMTLAQLASTISKGRKAASSQSAAADGDTAASTASSEQANVDGETEIVPSQSAESDDSTALAEAAQAEETTEPTDEAESPTEGDEADPEAKAEKKSIEKMEKRIDKVTEQRNSAREEAEYWKQKAMQAEQGREQPATAKAAPANATDERFANHPAIAEIDQGLNDAEAFLAWSAKHPEGGTFTEGGKNYELSAEEVASYRATSEKEARRLSARREARLEAMRGEFDQQRRASHAEAVRLYPWIEQKSSAEFQEALVVIRENPGLLQRPDFELVVARYVAGNRLEREAVKKLAGNPAGATARPKGGTVPTKVVTQAASAAPRSTAQGEATRAAESQMKQHVEKGRISTNDLGKLLAQRRQARIAAA